MKKLSTILALIISVSLSAIAHDEGHGPKSRIKTHGDYGGVLVKVFQGKDHASVKKDKPKFFAELVKDDDGKLSIYLYNDHLERVKSLQDLSNFKGQIEVGRGKRAKVIDLSLKKEASSIVGNLPQKIKGRVNVSVTFKKGSQSLVVIFENLD